jgi:hypothetical protein
MSVAKAKSINHLAELPLMGRQTGYGEVPYFRMAYYGAQVASCGHGNEISGSKKGGQFLKRLRNCNLVYKDRSTELDCLTGIH